MRLGQALFGYRGGHRRLASSISFLPGDERFLVRMTDLSGPRSMPGFEEYVSGYALPSGTAYVFAKTWYAPECERPGCVWTHVILVRHQDWTGLTSGLICGAFQRPALEKAPFECYSDSLDVSSANCEDEHFRSPRIGEEVLSALYSDDRPIVISEAEKRADIGPFLTKVLLQRPLAMRMAFSFCTGSLSFLATGTGPVRIQVMPFRISRLLREDVHLLPAEQEFANLRWTTFLLKDLHEHDVILRRLFDPFQKTDQSYDEREAVAIIRGLTEARVLFEGIQEGAQSAQASLRGIIEIFPDPKEQVAFKTNAIERMAETPVGRLALLQFVFEVGKMIVAFEGAEREVLVAASLTAKENPAAALKLLGDVLFKPSGTQFVQNVIHRLVTEVRLLDIDVARPIDPQILFAIARVQDELVSMPGFWLLQRSFDESADLAETLAEDLGEEIVLAGLLAADRFDLLVRMLRVRGSGGAREAFRLASGLSLGSSGDYEKVMALRGEVLDFAQALALGEACAMRPLNDAQLFILASSNVEPSRLVELVPELATWLKALAALPAEPQRIFALAIFFACGNEFTDGWKLFRKSFDVVHQAVAAKSIASEWWWLIKSRLPSLAVWEKWDKCERLRRGAVDSIIRRGLPPAALDEVSQDRGLQNRLRRLYKDRV
jgi:hypothetical protein